MIKIKKDQLIPEDYITFIIGNKVVNKYISAGNDLNIKKVKDNVYISFQNRKKHSILNTVMKMDAISMRKDGIDIYKNNLLNCPNIIFKGKCSMVCQFELLDDITITKCLH